MKVNHVEPCGIREGNHETMESLEEQNEVGMKYDIVKKLMKKEKVGCGFMLMHDDRKREFGDIQ